MAIGIFFGCTTRSTPYLYDNLVEFLKRVGVEYESYGLDLCCGAPLILAGKIKEAKEQAKKVVASIKTDVIVTPCPHCYFIIKHEYPEKLGVEVPFKVLHITQFVKDLLDQGKLKLKENFETIMTYHDPCYIGRQGDGIYDEPRAVLKSIPGVKYVELEHNREDTTCCGGGGFVRAFLPRLSAEVAHEKIEREVKPLGVETLVSSCPFCYLNLNDGSYGTEVKVIDLIDALLKGME